MKINVISRKLIKPIIPTPQNLSKHHISFIDALIPVPLNLGIILSYNPTSSDDISRHTRIRHLQKSLSQILPHFYPLAGRYIKKDRFVDCSDQGAEFIEAEAVDDNVHFADLVSKRVSEELNDLLHTKFYKVDELPTDPLLSIQVTGFKCGGLVISVSVSHRIFDASSVGTFIAAWANANNINGGPKTITIRPSFDSPTLFPLRNQSYGPDSGPPENAPDHPKLVVKRFSFNKEVIKTLKSNIISKNSMNISRVRVVSAIIAKALISMDRAKNGLSRPCMFIQAVNFRGRTVPPMPKDSCGNFLVLSPTRCMSEDETNNVNGIQELVDVLGDGLEKTIADCAEILSPGGDAHSIIMDPLISSIQKTWGTEVNFVVFSDWSKFGFYQLADFGWGKPVGVGIGATPGEKMIVLMDNKEGDGIEAWVHLNQDDMGCFEQDDDIKLLTT